MENQLEEIKQRIDIVSLVGEYVPLKKAGRNYKALCPFHGEKTPSFTVSPDRQIFKCFGCGEGGDAFTFVKKIEGLDFGDAARKLADRAGVELKEMKLGENEKRREEIYNVNKIATDFYNFLLTKHNIGKKAQEYLKSRGINSSSIKKFQLGFAPEKEDALVKFLAKKKFSGEEANKAGLSLVSGRGSIFDRFRGRIIFPIKNLQGKVVGFSGRVLGSREPKYLNTPDTFVFSKSNSLYGIDNAKLEIGKSKEAILVEGNLDVVSSHQVGVTNVVAPLGTALTERQVDSLGRFADTLIFAFDTDTAGSNATKRGIEIAENAGFSVKAIDLGESKDPDEVIRKSPSDWKKRVKNSISIYDFVLVSALSKWDATSAEGKRKISQETLPYIAKLSDEISKDHYVKKIAGYLSVSEDSVRVDLGKYLPKSKSTLAINHKEEEQTTPTKEKKLSLLEKYLLALTLQTGILSKDLDEEIFSQRETLDLFKIIKNHVNESGKINIKKLSGEIPVPLIKLYDEAILFGLSEKLFESDILSEKEISSCITRIKELNLRASLRRLGLEIKQAEAVDSSGRIKDLTKKFRDLSLQLTQIKGNS